MSNQVKPTVLEICAGGGGQALGVERAGFECVGAVEIDDDACETLASNRPDWQVIQDDLKAFSAKPFRGIDLLAGGVPCPPFSIAGKQLGPGDDRDLFPTALRLVREARPRAVMLENVRGLASTRFSRYLASIVVELKRLGYESDYRVLNACDFGVSQLRPRFVLVAVERAAADAFGWPAKRPATKTVGDVLFDLMAVNAWSGAIPWRRRAKGLAPTLVGGSRKHGGADLGPTRAKAQWRRLGVDGLGIANDSPPPDFPVHGLPRLTLRMVARLQGFPDSWRFQGKKTSSYRQIGNAFPPPVAEAVAGAIRQSLIAERGERMWPRRRSGAQLRLLEKRRAEA